MNIQPCVRALCPEDTGFLRVDIIITPAIKDFLTA